MPLLQFPLTSGVDEGVDPKALPPGRLTRLVNAAWTKDGRLDKRFGTKGLATTGAPTTAKRLLVRNGELCIVDGVSLYSWDPLESKWNNQGKVPEVGLTWRQLTDTVKGAASSDICRLSDGRMVHVWTAGDPTATDKIATYTEIVDPTTLARTLAPFAGEGVRSGRSAHVVTDGTNYVVIWVDTNTVRCMVNGSGTVATLSSGADAASDSAFDACACGTEFVIAYELGTGGIQLRRYSFATTPVQSAHSTVTGESGTGFIGISIDGLDTDGHLYIGYAQSTVGGPAKIAIHNTTTLAQTLAPTNVDATATAFFRRFAVKRLDSSHCLFAYSANGQAAATYASGMTGSYVISTSGVLTAERQTFCADILSRPFVMNGLAYMFVADAAQSQAFAGYGASASPPLPGVNGYLVQIETTEPAGVGVYPHRYVGMTDLLISGAWTAGYVANVVTEDAFVSRAVLPVQDEFPGTRTHWSQGVKLVTITRSFDAPNDLWGSVEIGGEAYMAAAVLTAYDGRRPFDYGFSREMIDKSTSAMAGSGGSLAAGNYIYSAFPSYKSAAGVWHRGPCAEPWTFTAAASDKMTLALVSQTLSCKDNSSDPLAAGTDSLPVAHVVYRSVVNGVSLQKRSIEPSADILLNVAGASPSSFVDSSSDATLVLSAKPVIYNVGELDEFQPPGFVSVHLHRRRIFGIEGDLRTVWFSKDHGENPGIAPGFSPDQRLMFDEDIVGMRTLDERLVVFSADSIWVVAGDGPTVNGENSDYAPVKIQADKGCVNARSLVSTPLGIIYESPTGISILTRKLESQWIGKAVQDLLAVHPVITSATLDAANNRVRISCNTDVFGATGIVLVYDYNRAQWSTFTYWDAARSAPSCGIADAVIWNGVWTFVTAFGKVYTEDSTISLDNGDHWIEEDWELAEIEAAGPLGYQRVRKVALIGQRLSDCDIRIRIAVNGTASLFIPTYDQDYTWTSDVIAALGTANLTRVVKTQKNASIRIRYTDASPTGPGAVVGTGLGANVSAVGLDIEPKEGITRRPAKAVA